MLKRALFRHHWLITLLVVAAGITLVWRLPPAERMPAAIAVVGVGLGFGYFVQQQRLAETSLFKELFTEFNARYDRLNEILSALVEAGRVRGAEDRQRIVDYFNLCAEEYLFHLDGYIHPKVWRTWCRGMLFYLEREPFKTIWEEEERTSSYYGLTLKEIRRGAV